MQMSLAEEVVKMLKNAGMTVTTVESCTGGLLSGTLVDVAGVSEVLNSICILLNSVGMKAMANPYTMAIGTELMMKLPAIINSIPNVSSPHVTID